MMMLLLALRPRSLQGGRLGYQTQIARQATRQYHGPKMHGELYARVVWLHDYAFRAGSAMPDIDNIVKPLLDALKGLAFDDDCAVVRLACSRHQMDQVAIPDPVATGLPDWWHTKLCSMLADDDCRDIVCLEVAPTSSRVLVVGPVDMVNAHGIHIPV